MMRATSVTLRKYEAIALALRKQHLAADAAEAAVLEVIDDLVGLHATDTGSPYLQMRARLPGFAPGQLDAVLDAGSAARVPCMRSTLFIQPSPRLPLLFAATRRGRVRGRERYMAAYGLTEARYRRLASRVEQAVAGNAMDARELQAAVGVKAGLSPVIILMCDDARLVRWKAPTGWQGKPPTYRRFEEAVASGALAIVDEQAALTGLVDWYLRRYGPVTERDVVWWTGLPARNVHDAIAALPAIFQVHVEGAEGPHLLHEHDLSVLHGKAGRARPVVALLPVLDPFLQGRRQRERFIDNAHLPYVVDRGGNVTSVVLVDGRVAGVWDHVARSGEVRVLFLAAPRTEVRRQVIARAAEVGEYLAGRPQTVLQVEEMIPISERGAGAVLSPLAPPRAAPTRRQAAPAAVL